MLATITSTIPSAATSTGGSNCGTGTVSMTASGCSGGTGTVSWYGSLTGGSALSTGNNFTTPSISTTTTYYIDCTVSGCTSSSRSSAVATITPCSSATITSTGTLIPFSTCAGVASSSQTFSISGTSLTADIVLTAPTGYELSIDAGANYFATLTLTQLRGVVTSTTVYVRLKSDATNGASGNVSATSTGATTVNVATGTGVVIALPTFSNQPSSSIQNLCLNQPATALTVSVSGGSGYSYKWYSNTTNTNSGGSEIGGATNASYTPTTSVVGTTYYYCVVSYTSCSVSSPGKPNGSISSFANNHIQYIWSSDSRRSSNVF
jgi:hypothetical protein